MILHHPHRTTERAWANVRAQWQTRVNQTVEANATWLFGEPLPDWVCRAWNAYTDSLYRAVGGNVRAVNWSEHWCAFVNCNLAYDPRWKAAVEAKLQEGTDERAG